MQSSLRSLSFARVFLGFGARFTHTTATLKANTLDAGNPPWSHFAKPRKLKQFGELPRVDPDKLPT
jgi:hypothetical protein